MTEEKKPLTLKDRITAIVGDVDLNDIVSLEYSWHDPDNTGAGYERLIYKHANGGGQDYHGVYHPNVVCEGGGVCKHCGRTLIFD